MVQAGNLSMSRCACGGGIVVAFPTPVSIEQAVRRHRLTRHHREWWAAVQPDWQGPLKTT